MTHVPMDAVWPAVYVHRSTHHTTIPRRQWKSPSLCLCAFVPLRGIAHTLHLCWHSCAFVQTL